MKSLLIATAVATAGFMFSLQAFAASIIGLGSSPSGLLAIYPYGVSSDGSTVVGIGYSASNNEAFAYQNGQVTGLGYLPGDNFSRARDLSADGNTVVGRSSSGSSSFTGEEAFIYQNGQMTGLGYLANDSFSDASGVSADGSIVVGVSKSTSSQEAFVYQNGLMTGLGYLAGGSFSNASGVSADGSAIVGTSSSTAGSQAFIFQNGQMTGLGDLAGGFFLSNARGVSADGSTVVGYSSSASSFQAFVHQNGQMTGLAELPLSSYSDAFGVSADGSIVVGVSGSEAVVWQENGNGDYSLSRLQDELFILGVDITSDGWNSLIGALNVSDDGNLVVGYGERNGLWEGFLVDLSATAVPIPAAVWLFGSALIGLTGLRKFHKHQF